MFTLFDILMVRNFRFPIGSHVVGAFIMPCGNCFYCVKVVLQSNPNFSS